ncbi:MAG: NVEALA domain-containing protein [Candidatus Symbiothrix sp.]|jgi:hypothetical protein|nr:NVEALA domain-containing protein [Candidatus Symbiothrix sp.]
MTIKKIICGIAVLAVAVIATVNVAISNKNVSRLTDRQLANVEALAQNEQSTYSCSASANCFYHGVVIGSVSCTGTSICLSGFQFVICDGITSECI